VYIDIADKELVAVAIAALLSQIPVSFIYDDGAPQKVIPGHGNAIWTVHLAREAERLWTPKAGVVGSISTGRTI
jgi:hypothetical protein